MQIQRFTATDDDVHGFCDDEYEAGYDARLAGVEWSMCATRSWRAGWTDADMGCSPMIENWRTARLGSF
jgi:hypothetical protein